MSPWGGQDFPSFKHTKLWKIYLNYHKLYQTAINNSKWPKIFRMGIKYTNIFHSKALQNLPKLGF
jgi:hypothetical protein